MTARLTVYVDPSGARIIRQDRNGYAESGTYSRTGNAVAGALREAWDLLPVEGVVEVTTASRVVRLTEVR